MCSDYIEEIAILRLWRPYYHSKTNSSSSAHAHHLMCAPTYTIKTHALTATHHIKHTDTSLTSPPHLLISPQVHQLNPVWSEEHKQRYIKNVTREYKIHREMRHPRVVDFYDVFEIDVNSFATVLEYCRGIDLDEKYVRDTIRTTSMNSF